MIKLLVIYIQMNILYIYVRSFLQSLTKKMHAKAIQHKIIRLNLNFGYYMIKQG